MEFHVGDRVLGTKDAFSHRVGKLGRVTRPQGKSSAFVLWDGADQDHFAHRSEIVRIEEGPMRNEDKPKIWRDMTPEEKGALLLGWHEGKVIEAFGVSYPDMWCEDDPVFMKIAHTASSQSQSGRRQRFGWGKSMVSGNLTDTLTTPTRSPSTPSTASLIHQASR
jgi:hypothetical protein